MNGNKYNLPLSKGAVRKAVKSLAVTFSFWRKKKKDVSNMLEK